MPTSWEFAVMKACYLSCFLLALVIPLLPAAKEEKKKPPFREREPALKLFAEEFVPIKAGKFEMGSSDKGPKEEQPAHEVAIDYDFAMARYEVTQELYQALMGKNPAKWQGPRNSVEMVSHADAVEFCRRATYDMRDMKLIGNDELIRLPSEVEWEYCCRAGTTTPFSFGDEKDIRAFCWFKDNSPGNDPPVGEKKANPWGLHEMHGYVWEWVADSWHPSYKDAPADGSAWQEKDAKQYVVRGGAFNSPPDRCRSAAREAREAAFKNDALGFRCVKAKTK
jgi:formylglycine-generating enzyme required for sulfatase activity